MSSEREACDLVRRVAEPRTEGDSVSQAIMRAARRLRWSITRTKALWYGEARRIDAAEMDQLRSLARDQAARYSRMAEALRHIDPEMYSPDIDALISAAQRLGGED